ncbi:MAG: hypothetical protein FWG38_03315 [Defluviitaleaceae bacterium]|jgi:hypothetical protein|nr:hypothetical protein [Defluviitaleaceae bacterium]
MNKIANWNWAQKLQASNKKGIITGLIIALLVIAIVVVVIVKMQWLKKHFGCDECDLDLDDFDLDFDEDGGVYTSESDFV